MLSLISTNLFKPVAISENIELSHRLVHAPLTRYRASKKHVPTDLMLQYYDDRSKTPGSLVIMEATFISPKAGGYDNVPGIWSKNQIDAWKLITNKVHQNGSFASLQLWALGRQAKPDVLANENQKFVSSSSDIYINDLDRELAEKLDNPLTGLTLSEIDQWIQDYAQAAQNAIDAGFDVVEIHAAHGYLIDQFVQKTANQRTDEYGGSIENRSKFLLNIVDAIIDKISDAKKVAIRLSPWAQHGGMKGTFSDLHPIATFGYVISELQKRADNGNQLAYISIVEPRASGNQTVSDEIASLGDNQWIYHIWKGIIIRAGTYTSDSPKYSNIIKDVQNNNRTLIAIGRHFVSNPDLVQRLKNGWPLTDYDRSTFYIIESNFGYNDWPIYGDTPTHRDNQFSNKTAVPLA
ncbi:alkene reductase [Ascoidea rubescens DSM 1968]|uniref:NADH:flavin oxidoreductase/NADH oxidase n=1 Tax=Ascoidea rubescens DSM 1968 TaxID=1344418 RepID=A0A1D2VB82_9ASCO|nr:NADH:flavin oxidoreductase/NADH oxidase [Ascoidea rubescens DSM 1968]ODV58954.1 NADH:flavin oxidoreductase/NADH oxidase [Ascoidea rubescens DSM 1968]